MLRPHSASTLNPSALRDVDGLRVDGSTCSARSGSLSPIVRHKIMTRIGVLAALIAIVFGPLYTDPQYNWLHHTVSELAAQNTRNAWVMQIGLSALGIGIAVDFLRHRHPADIPFVAFGLFVTLSALFPHRPFVEGRAFSEALDLIHSVCASLTGLSAVLGFVVRCIVEKQLQKKWVYASLAVMYTVLPLMMTIYPSLAGVFQRVIFGSFFVWAVMDYPKTKMPNNYLQRA